jgi:hypothetical protein
MKMNIYSILVERKNMRPSMVPVCRNCIEGYPCSEEVHGVKCKGNSGMPGLIDAINIFKSNPQVMRELLFKS